jgi:hypothetical protein
MQSKDCSRVCVSQYTVARRLCTAPSCRAKHAASGVCGALRHRRRPSGPGFTLCFASPLDDEEDLVATAASFSRVRCLRLLLEHGAPWDPITMLELAGNNRLDALEVLLDVCKELPWCAVVPNIAANLGQVRFLRMIADAGWPTSGLYCAH